MCFEIINKIPVVYSILLEQVRPYLQQAFCLHSGNTKNLLFNGIGFCLINRQ